jgi:hypothetical protein
MNVPVLPEPGFSNRIKPEADAVPERAEAACLQEQFTSPIPVRNERPMAEILIERLAGTTPACPSPAFLP